MFLSNLEKGTSIFIDANISIYHFSKESRFNQACSSFLEYIEAGSMSGFTSTSIVQEITHRMKRQGGAILNLFRLLLLGCLTWLPKRSKNSSTRRNEL